MAHASRLVALAWLSAAPVAHAAAAASLPPCGRNVTFVGPWPGGDAWLVNYSGPFSNDRPPHVQLGADPDVRVGQVACLSACRATTSKAIEWEVDGVWNAALNETAHLTVYYGSDAAKKVDTYCAPAAALPAQPTVGVRSPAVTCDPGTYYKKWGPDCGQDCCACVPGNYCPGDQGGCTCARRRAAPASSPQFSQRRG